MPARFAQKMTVKGGICVVACSKAFDGNGLDDVLFGQQLDRVVNRGFGQSGEAFAKAGINVIDRRMGSVRV